MRHTRRMKDQLFVSLAFCALLAAACGATTASARDAASKSETHSLMTTTSSTHTISAVPPTIPSPASATTRACTQADLEAPPMTVMPAVETLTSPMTLDSGNESLSPPDSQPKVKAAQAWSKVTASGFGPRQSGKARLLLADLDAKTPATIQNYSWPPTSDHPDTQATPDYTQVLVWVVLSTDQADVGSGGGSAAAGSDSGPSSTSTTVAEPLCFLETAVTYVDADTGSLISSETF